MKKRETDAKKGSSQPLDEEGRRLWQKVTESVQSYSSRKEPATRSKTPADKPVRSKSVAVRAVVEAKPSKATPFITVTRTESKNPAQTKPGFDRTTETKLKKGKLDIEGRLDMHGMTQEEAFHSFRRFIQSAQRQDKRTLLVITGKGGMTSKGVLRRMLPLWVEDMPAILACTPAQPKDGGNGAFYIRLRKKKQD